MKNLLYTLKKAIARFQPPRQPSNLELIQRVELKFLCLHLRNLKKRNELLMEWYKKSQRARFEVSNQIQGSFLSNLDIYMQSSLEECRIFGAISENAQEIRETEIRIKTSITNLRGE